MKILVCYYVMKEIEIDDKWKHIQYPLTDKDSYDIEQEALKIIPLENGMFDYYQLESIHEITDAIVNAETIMWSENYKRK